MRNPAGILLDLWEFQVPAWLVHQQCAGGRVDLVSQVMASVVSRN
jgi:hypothetical protein